MLRFTLAALALCSVPTPFLPPLPFKTALALQLFPALHAPPYIKSNAPCIDMALCSALLNAAKRSRSFFKTFFQTLLQKKSMSGSECFCMIVDWSRFVSLFGYVSDLCLWFWAWVVGLGRK